MSFKIGNTYRKGKIPWNKGLKGVQKHTEETKLKMSESGKRRVFSEEHKQNIRKNHKGMKGKKHSEKTKKIMSENNVGMLGKKHSEKSKQKMSVAKIGKLPSWKSGRGKGSYYDSLLQGKIYLRSSWELRFVQHLDKNNIPWLYEIQTFNLGNSTYTPDFYLPTINLFVEIKGYMKKESQKKINKFLDIYHEETLQILYKEDLIKLGIDVK